MGIRFIMGDEEPPEKKRKKWLYDNGEYYGDVENGKRHGQGTYTWTTGDKFKGKWEAGIRNGVGFLKYTKGTKYEGQWKNDEPEGRGIITWSHGIRFKGIFSVTNRIILQTHKRHPRTWLEARRG